jgi:ABC-type polysaccharide/polyol phosphate transport system ATPase subunit
VQGRVAPLIELGAGMHLDLTGIENIYMNGTILGLSIRELKRDIGKIVEFS